MATKTSENPFTTAIDALKNAVGNDVGVIDLDVDLQRKHQALSQALNDEIEKVTACPAGFEEVNGMCVKIL